MRKLMYTVTGPSCAGKTTLMQKLLEQYPDKFSSVISDTTRDPRAGEIHGKEYAFVSEEEFKIAQRSALYCQTVHYAGTYYGTRWDTITDIFAEGKVPVRVVEPTGVFQFREVCAELGAEVVAVFVNEDLELTVSRWLERSRTDSPNKASYYAYRIIKTITEEQAWVEEPIYDYYFDLRFKNETEHLYALSRIAEGSISPSMTKRISPNVYERTA